MKNSAQKVWLIAHGAISALSNYWKDVTYATWALLIEKESAYSYSALLSQNARYTKFMSCCW